MLDGSGAQETSPTPDYRQQQRLLGSLFSNPFVGKDESGEGGYFLCFLGIFCQIPGLFHLRFSLGKIDPAKAEEAKYFPFLYTVDSEDFDGYKAEDSPGKQAITELTKCLKE